jgi:photosystem II P680 reaction center D1 protein
MKNTSNLTYSASTWWGYGTSFILSTNNRLSIPHSYSPTLAYIAAFILGLPVDIDGIREPVAGSLLI